MNSVEQAIRAALGKGDAEDQSFRRRIYGSASAALERSLVARPFSDDDIKARRKSFLDVIKHIESEFLAATEAPKSQNSAASPDNDMRTTNVLNDLTRQPAASVASELEGRAALKPVTLKAGKKPRHWLPFAINTGVLLALILSGYWVYVQGKQIYADATISKPAAQKPSLAEPAVANENADAKWIEIFSARDTDLLSPAASAKAEITSRDGYNYVVMSGDSANEVSVKIGSGLVQTFAGKRVLFNITARSLDGATLETGVNCGFGPETQCERTRFRVGPQPAEYMFAVTIAASARGDGAVLIAPDLAAGGGMIEIETIRATIVEPDAG